MFAIARAFIKGKSVQEIHKKTLIDEFFLTKIKNVVDTNKDLREHLCGKKFKEHHSTLVKHAKLQGFSDKQIAIITEKKEKEVREFRHQENILPVTKKIDTLA